MATPIPLEIRNNPMNQPIPLIDSSMALQITAEPVEPEISPEQEAAQRLQFQNTKAKALEDAKLQQLKQKTETAASPAERYAALKEYYPQLFERMRKIDGTLEVQIDEMEAAARRRLERMQAGDVPKTSSR
jgi:vancomycin resistance protein YoaR